MQSILLLNSQSVNKLTNSFFKSELKKAHFVPHVFTVKAFVFAEERTTYLKDRKYLFLKVTCVQVSCTHLFEHKKVWAVELENFIVLSSLASI